MGETVDVLVVGKLYQPPNAVCISHIYQLATMDLVGVLEECPRSSVPY